MKALVSSISIKLTYKDFFVILVLLEKSSKRRQSLNTVGQRVKKNQILTEGDLVFFCPNTITGGQSDLVIFTIKGYLEPAGTTEILHP